MKTPTLPTNWRAGFTFPHTIGAGGTETPFLREGQWHLRCWNRSTQSHDIYNFSTDTFAPEVEEK